jgi:shikimate dehydrogenase
MNDKHGKMVFGLLGKSLGHSFSQGYFTKKFEAAGIDAVYQNFEIQDIDELKLVLEKENLRGLNVTIPYKTAVIPFLDGLSEEAAKIGAVNTIVNENGKWIGANTDAFGFQQMIKPFLLNTHERALILGNGGASKAVAYVLKSIGLDVLFAARNPLEGQFRLSEVNDMMVKHCGIIVNTTPVGTWPNVDEFISIPFEALTDAHLVVDLIYNPEQTAFLRQAAEQDATTLNGLTMLYQQAEKSWQLWKAMI